jgi:hypothetical protein
MPADGADRNLLLGVLALQAGLIDCDQFVRACTLWATRKETPLADVLCEQGWLAPQDRALVEALLERTLTKHRGDARASLAEVTADRARRSLAEVLDPGFQKSLASLPAGGGSGPVSTVAYRPGSRERYTLSRLHAEGGIGRVWVAFDGDLGREIALKELRPEAQDPAAAARFLEEARITGQLEHPGIVPVYELVKPADGRPPFYTMRLIKGRTLDDAIRAYHRKRGAGETGPLDLAQLLTAFVGVCNAVAYAHARGVLHRDLKPRNVVLGDFGEVVVLDWGLAKARGSADTPAGLASAPVEPGAVRDRTEQGQVLGTPSYMAPEQAEGRPDLVDERSDVYGLGAVLYEILTGRPPFTGANTPDVLRQVAREAPVPPRQRVAATARALEAVCLKALAKDPGGRYPSSRELAQDAQRWLADEPVSAYPEPLLWRAARWCRRRPLVTAWLGFCAILDLAVAALVVGQLVQHEALASAPVLAIAVLLQLLFGVSLVAQVVAAVGALAGVALGALAGARRGRAGHQAARGAALGAKAGILAGVALGYVAAWAWTCYTYSLVNASGFMWLALGAALVGPLVGGVVPLAVGAWRGRRREAATRGAVLGAVLGSALGGLLAGVAVMQGMQSLRESWQRDGKALTAPAVPERR